MCLIITADPKQPIPDYVINSAALKNPDGWGIIWHENGKTKVKRSLDMSKLLKFSKSLEKYPRVVHLRMATHGTVNLVNCHPFKVRENLFFAHNGVMSEYGCLKDDKSDTSVFNETIVRPLAEMYSGSEILNEVWFRHAMEKFAGQSQRFAFMDDRGSVLRVGPWQQHKGVWVSNNYAWSYPYEQGGIRRTIQNFYSGNDYKPVNRNVDIYDYRKSKDYDDFWKKSVNEVMGIQDEEAEDKSPKLLTGESADGIVVEFSPEVEELIVTAIEESSEAEFSFTDLQALPENDLTEALSNSPDFCAKIIKNAKHVR